MVPMRLLYRVLRPILNKAMSMRRSQFEALAKAPPGRVVFLGDSITEQGIWAEWFPELATLNRGIGGDSVGGVITRLDSALHAPVAISLLIGTNDLAGLGASHKVDDIAAQMDTLLGRIREMAPEALLLVNSVMPRSKSLIDEIEQLNRRYQDLAAKYGAAWVDVWPLLAAADRTLRKDLSGDGTHLNGAGYQIWVDALRPHLVPS